jgi:hypothetical protein
MTPDMVLPLSVQEGRNRWGGFWFLQDGAGNMVACTSNSTRKQRFLQLVELVNGLGEEHIQSLTTRRLEENYVV